jgi:acetyl-CoA carboxylase biotin carboxyl carrier protein
VVADDVSSKPGPFDVPTIKSLVALMSRHDLSEIDLHDGTQRIRLRRDRRPTAVPPSNPGPTPTALPASVAPVLGVPPAPAPAAEKPGKALQEIKSPTVGTFYAREKPEANPYVGVGVRVTPTTIVGLIEAMKLFNEIYAGCSGVITEVLVENQQPVEYGQVLFRVDPAR